MALLETVLPRAGGGRPALGATCRLAEQIKGRALYHGGGWIGKKYRSRQLAPWAFRMGQAIGFLEFNPDWIYGFVAETTAERGFAYRLGFVHLQPHAIDRLAYPACSPMPWHGSILPVLRI